MFDPVKMHMPETIAVVMIGLLMLLMMLLVVVRVVGARIQASEETGRAEALRRTIDDR